MDDIKPTGEKSIFGAIIFFLVGLPLFLIGMILIIAIPFEIFINQSLNFETLKLGGAAAVLAFGGLWCMKRARKYCNGTAKAFPIPDNSPTFFKTLAIVNGNMWLSDYLLSYLIEYPSTTEVLLSIIFNLLLTGLIVWTWQEINSSKAQ